MAKKLGKHHSLEMNINENLYSVLPTCPFLWLTMQSSNREKIITLHSTVYCVQFRKQAVRTYLITFNYHTLLYTIACSKNLFTMPNDENLIFCFNILF